MFRGSSLTHAHSALLGTTAHQVPAVYIYIKCNMNIHLVCTHMALLKRGNKIKNFHNKCILKVLGEGTETL